MELPESGNINVSELLIVDVELTPFTYFLAAVHQPCFFVAISFSQSVALRCVENLSLKVPRLLVPYWDYFQAARHSLSACIFSMLLVPRNV